MSKNTSNEKEPPPRKPLVSRILCAFKCQYHRFTRPSKNGETENQKMNEWWRDGTGRVGVRPERTRKNSVAPTAKPIGTMPVCTENLDSNVMVMKSTKDRVRFNASGRLNRTGDRRTFIQ